jgi:hypothetical protein
MLDFLAMARGGVVLHRRVLASIWQGVFSDIRSEYSQVAYGESIKSP